jgi:hypothetical protein
MNTTPATPGPTTEAPAYAAVTNPKPEAIVVYCSDPRLQAAFDQFISQELHLAKGQYIPIVVGGGAGVLGHPEQLPKEFKFLKERFEMYREHFPSVRRVVLINHEDCKYYNSLKSKVSRLLGSRLGHSLHVSCEDLGLVRHAFQHLLSHLGFNLEFYYARFADDSHQKVVFEKVSF